MSQEEKMIVPIIDGKLARELEAFDFSTVRLTRALHYSGNASLEAAINWIAEHENDPDIDKMPLVPSSPKAEALKPALTEEKKIKAQQLREQAYKKKEAEEKRMERVREKERIRVGKEILEAKRMDEEKERERMIAYREAEKAEERRARAKILQKLEEDKAARRQKLGLPPRNPTVSKSTLVVKEKKSFLPVKPATKAERMRDCLRSLKRNHKNEDARVKRAFQTLLIYVGNVAKNPDEEKFRKIRLNNPSFQERVGSLKEGVEFLELCGFEKDDKGGFLFLDRDKMNLAVLNSAGTLLNYAIANPFFGIL